MRHGWLAGLVVVGSCSLALAGEETEARRLTILDGDGKPVAGAVVHILWPEVPSSFVKPVRSDEVGIAVLPAGDADGIHGVIVTPPSARGDLAELVLSGDASELPATITLPPGRTLTITLVDERGLPAFAKLIYEVDRDRSVEPRAYGQHVLRHRPRSPIRLLAIPGKHAGAALELMDRPGAPILDVPVETDRVKLVVWKDAPVIEQPELRVVVTGPDGQRPANVRVHLAHRRGTRTHSARNGEVTIELPPVEEAASGRPGPPGEAEGLSLLVYAATDAKGNPLPWAARSIALAPGQREVAVQMEEGLVVEGRVVDEHRHPVAGARVVALHGADEIGGHPQVLASSTTGEDGRFRLEGLGPDGVGLRVDEGPTWAASPVHSHHGAASDMVLEVVSARGCTLLVHDGEGKPVEGVPWMVMEVRTTERGTRSTSIAAGTADAEGRRAVPPLDGRRNLTLSLKAFEARPDLRGLDIEDWTPGDATHTLPAGFAVEVNVVDAEGRPTRALITRRTGGGTNWTHTDVRGRLVALGLDPQRTYEIHANHPDDRDGPKSSTVEVSATSHRVTVRLQLPPKEER
ncbi:MAG: carboxypeptidase-like regulatory domain-containing protein [Planctomycetota bacterium]